MKVIIENAHRAFLLLLILCCNSCYKEVSRINIVDGKNEFYLQTDSENEAKLYSIDSIQYDLTPTPNLIYGNTRVNIDRFSIRGQSTLQFRRKSFSINVSNWLGIPNSDSNDYLILEKFKLLSMPFDYTYIEHKLSISILEELNLWSLHSFYTLLHINQTCQGIYLFVEDPTEHIFKNKNAQFILRRNYNHEISKFELNPNIKTFSEEYYINKFNHLYNILPKYSGKQLFDSLNTHLNMKNYMRKMAVDLILANGDYTDEVYFYAYETSSKQIKFDIIPWDYDDIFSSTPHEVGREWAVGTVFGDRSYSSVSDVLDELNGRPLYSIEDDLDYIISKDNYLYSKYLESLTWVLTRINKSNISYFFDKTQSMVEPFYSVSCVIEQSNYDKNSTDESLFYQNLINKEIYLKNRIGRINSVLESEIIKMQL